MAAGANLIGKKFFRLSVLSRAENRYGKRHWNCVCKCGVEVVVSTGALMAKHSMSCGCYNNEIVQTACKTHGMRYSREYRIWNLMIDRCENPKNKFFAIYGGRGILMCKRWRESFADFYADMGQSPPNHSIDRINNNGNYEPGNCRWSDAKTQARNTTRNRMIAFNGETLALSAWAERLGLRYGALLHRAQRNWSAERMFTTPIKGACNG